MQYWKRRIRVDIVWDKDENMVREIKMEIRMTLNEK